MAEVVEARFRLEGAQHLPAGVVEDQHDRVAAATAGIAQLPAGHLERAVADYLGFEDTILFAACFDANGGLFEPLLGPEDAVISDALNHASIIDGIRLCKAQRLRYANDDMDELETRLKESAAARVRLIATDGVFSMDGSFANLGELARLAADYGALTMVDDCHATGFIGPQGRGTAARVFVNDCIAKLLEGKLDVATASMAKYWVTELQSEVVDKCLQFHGGAGYINDYAIARMYRDTRIARIYGGSNEIMKMLIARSM